MNLNNKIIRWGIISCGNATEFKSGPAYQLTQGFKLGTLMRRNQSLALDYAKWHKISAYYSDAINITNNLNIEAVYVATTILPVTV